MNTDEMQNNNPYIHTIKLQNNNPYIIKLQKLVSIILYRNFKKIGNLQIKMNDLNPHKMIQMNKFDELTFEIDNLESFNNIFIAFISTFLYYNGTNKCKDDESKNLKINQKFLYYALKSTIFGSKMSQRRINYRFTLVYFIIITFYLGINGKIFVLLCMVNVVQKSMVWDTASSGKTKRAGAFNPMPFKSIFYEDSSPIIISCISEGFHGEKRCSSATTLFSDKKNCKMTQIM